MAAVYWIHLPSHTDLFSEGYVGFTSKTTAHRFKGHKGHAKDLTKNNPIQRAIRKYGDELVVETLCICDVEYGLWLETKLRPTPGIGWNVGPGGACPTLGIKADPAVVQKMIESRSWYSHSDETKEKLSETKRGVAKSKAHRVAMKYSRGLGPKPPLDIEKHKKDKRGLWKNGRANKSLWLMAGELFESYIEEDCGHIVLAQRFNLPSHSLSKILRYFESGWNPSEDLEWLQWKQEQTEQERIANGP